MLKAGNAKTEALAYDAAGDKEAFQRKAVQIKEKNARYKAFCKENNLTPKLDRTQVVAYNRSVAGKAVGAENRVIHSKYKDYLGTKTPTETARIVSDITSAGDKHLLDGFVKAVKKGDISVLVGIDVYRDVAREVEKELIGLVAVNGIEIKGYTTHFIDRVIGQAAEPHKGKRMGVTVETAKDVLTTGSAEPITYNKKGQPSQRIAGEKAKVTINPITGVLIQTNPRK